MSKINIDVLGTGSNVTTLERFVRVVKNYPERNIIVNFREWIGCLPDTWCTVDDIGDIKIHADEIPLSAMNFIEHAMQLSEKLKQWSPMTFLRHYCDDSGQLDDGKSDEFNKFTVQSSKYTVGIIQYREKSKHLPQYIVHHQDGEYHLAKSHIDVFNIIASTN